MDFSLEAFAFGTLYFTLSDTPNNYHMRVRFSIRAAFVVGSVLCIIVAGLSLRIRDARETRDALIVVSRLGGRTASGADGHRENTLLVEHNDTCERLIADRTFADDISGVIPPITILFQRFPDSAPFTDGEIARMAGAIIRLPSVRYVGIDEFLISPTQIRGLKKQLPNRSILRLPTVTDNNIQTRILTYAIQMESERKKMDRVEK